MSIWFFLSEWFGDIPTYGALFRRMIAHVIIAVGAIYFLIAFEAPDNYAMFVVLAMFVANGALVHFHRQQRIETTKVS